MVENSFITLNSNVGSTPGFILTSFKLCEEENKYKSLNLIFLWKNNIDTLQSLFAIAMNMTQKNAFDPVIQCILDILYFFCI